MENYVLIIFPDSQEFMECDWFEEEAILDKKMIFGHAAYFIPIKRWVEFKTNKQ